jgi:hypothetical protein
MKKKRKIPGVCQYTYMQERGPAPCEIKFQNTDHDRLMIIINNKCSYPDGEETFQLIRAMHRCGTVQFGREFHDRIQRYLDTVHIIG